ncbi:putative solute carrier family 22 member 20 [Apostichopus japonicus]|uniref:Putative solute carrier family 22 member 20 n=1 Tax=Stichopus japonicus TaxID=307972 RepID=A0A2G8L9Q3_STIJA|nr:putative solute carrier family 22 member 20 [Apostichopus japonicus]
MLNYTSDECRDLFRPLDDNGKDFSKCQKYNLSGLDHETILANRDNLTFYGVVDCDEGWIFDRSVYPSTLTEEWELVCDKEAVPNILQSVYLAGFVVGCLLFGYLADK